MDEHFTDDDLRALRAADPAAGIEAPEALRDRVAGMPGEEPVSAPVPLRRRRRWLLPVAAAGAVVAAIGVGYVWGTGGMDLGPAPAPLAVETGTPDDPAAPIGLGGGSGTQDAPVAGSIPGAVDLPGDGAAAPFSTSTSIAYGWGLPTRQRFILPTFEEMSGQASVYAVDARAQYSAEDAARVAATLGLTGDVRDFEEGGGGGWIVGDPSDSHFILTHWAGALAQFNKTGVEQPMTACHFAVSTRYPTLDGASHEVVDAFYAEVEHCLADTPMPTEEQAHEALRSFLAATGMDIESTHVTMTPDTEHRVLSATAAWVVQNNTTEIMTSVRVSAAGLLYGSGPTGEVVSLGEYTIVSPAEAAARLNDPAFSPRLVSSPETDVDYPEYTTPTAPPELPGAGSTVPWHIAEHEIVSARLGLALLHGPNGEQYLAPAYEFTASDETVWSVIALAEEGLDTTTSPGP